MYPITRLRRLRQTAELRDMIRETHLHIEDFVYPMFVCPGKNIKEEIVSMPGQYRYSVDNLVEVCSQLYNKGLKSVMLFGIPEYKDETGSASMHDHGIVQIALNELKARVPGLVTIADVCLCEYTSHGHCGAIVDGDVHNDQTELLAKQAVSFANAGAGMIAPSDMMDGRIAALRNALDTQGYTNLPIMAYSAKFASAFYGPFREAADSAPKFGDRKTYQMDVANAREALREIEQDVLEGADIVMVKPAMAFLDIVSQARQQFSLPIAAYNVSGEYAMVKAAAANGWIDGQRVMTETLLSIKRAGADIILTYFVPDIIDELGKVSHK